MVSSLTYRDQSRVYLEQANEELQNEDLLQASEKGWGAAAQILKAVAEERGWAHNGHRHLHNSVSRLIDETGDGDLKDLFARANYLHVNFYEGWLDRNAVEYDLRQVTRLVEKVEALLDTKS